MTEAKPDDIVGHKTFRSEDGFSVRHEPLLRAEAEAMLAASDAHIKERAIRLPDEQSAIRAMFDAFDRLRELGWREVSYCPKDGSSFEVIEAGSTGIHPCFYSGEWPDGYWMVGDDFDMGPSRPILFRLYPEDQAREDARKAELHERFRKGRETHG